MQFLKDFYGSLIITVICLGIAGWWGEYEREQPVEDRSRYGDAEKAAKIASIGLWADEHPIEPSKFRRKK